MPGLELYSQRQPIGLLKGFSPSPHQLEIEAVVPHAESDLPGFGEFLLIELGPHEALVVRVNHYHLTGQLATERGDAYLVDLARSRDDVPVELRQQILRYTLKLQMLGLLEFDGEGQFSFSVGHRNFARLGGKVRSPSAAALEFLCSVGLESDRSAVPLGHLIYGQREFPEVTVKFSISRLKARRSFVFARAGYGKSNLIKYLVSQLYSSPPDVGLLIFDPEGEYALPDDQGRPGLVNVPSLQHRISLYTNRAVPEHHASVRRGDVFIDFGDFPPQDILAACVSAEKQETVFANLVRNLDWAVWRKLVELLHREGFGADDAAVARLLSYKTPRQGDVSLAAVKNNLVPAIKRLHRPGATLGKNIIEELRRTRVVIIDISLLGGEDGLAISSLLLRRIFFHNLRHLTDLSGASVRCLAVLEEAQTLLGERAMDDRNVFVRWVKEGRKYGLGALLVTQQPGAIANQIISQGDNFFVLHLLNESDLQTLKRHNAYFTDEILHYIRSEPIPGNCYFWSAPSQPYVLPVRVLDFASVCERRVRAAEARQGSANQNWQGLVPAMISRALAENQKLWLYRVAAFAEKKETGAVAFSADYLRNAIAGLLAESGHLPHDGSPGSTQTVHSTLVAEIEKVLRRMRARAGYAVLEGVTRPVWVLPQPNIKLVKGKTLRTGFVEVLSKI